MAGAGYDASEPRASRGRACGVAGARAFSGADGCRDGSLGGGSARRVFYVCPLGDHTRALAPAGGPCHDANAMSGPPRASPRGWDARTWLVLGALWVLATALNLGKPFHIDDIYYLEEAQWIAEHPLTPMSGEMYWITDRPEPFYLSNNSPVLIPYLQAAVLATFGLSPLALHGLTAIFSAAAIVLFHALARRLAPRNALLLTAIFVLSPSFLAEQNIMLDVPLVATWLAFFLAFGDGSRPRQWWTAAAVSGAAVMIKFTSFALLFFLVAEGLRTRAWRKMLALTVPAAVLGGWSLWNYLEYGGIQILARPLEYGAPQLATGRAPIPELDALKATGTIVGRAALWIVTLGGIATGFYALLPRLWRTPSMRRFLIGCAIALGILVPIGRALVVAFPEHLAGEPFVHTVLRGAFFLFGLVLLCLCWQRMRAGDDDDKRLMLWIVSAAAFIFLLSPFVAARHVLVALPAVLFLVARRADLSFEGLERPMVAVAAVLGIWLAISDWRIAAVYRDYAPRITRHLAGAGRIFFVGHWGWQFYGKQEGWQVYVPDQTELRPGDVLVEPEGVAAQPIAEADRARLVLRETIVVPSGPIDVLRSLIDREGLYCVWKGLPWTLRTEPLERFFLYDVAPRPEMAAHVHGVRPPE
jgi:4-amino-4-deoxy-L-arabinose transferase-like glycosyltransferase